MANEDKLTTGLALSRGGFRATLLNLGRLWRLEDVGGCGGSIDGWPAP